MMTFGQTTMWLCCKLMLHFQHVSLCDSSWSAQVTNYAGKVIGLCQIWRSLSSRLQPEVSRLLSLWNSISHWETCINVWPSGVVSPACFVCKNLRLDVCLREDVEVKLWKSGCKSKHERWYLTTNLTHTFLYMKALTDRQRCLVVLRYDDVAPGFSTDTVTHTLQQ